MYLRLLYFSILWIKILDGYQIAGLEELGLWSTSQSSLWIWSLRLKIRVDFPLSILWGYFPFTNTLCNKYCLMILPLFVAICEIWLPGLTYGVYLILFLKPGATSFPTMTSLEVFASFSNEERMSTSHGRLAGWPRCLNPSPLCARPYATSDILARASVDLNQHQWYLAYHTPEERLLQQCVLHTKLITGWASGEVFMCKHVVQQQSKKLARLILACLY